jgi:TRAP-type C4-dicarboxylate transport system substrate-binding protein
LTEGRSISWPVAVAAAACFTVLVGSPAVAQTTTLTVSSWVPATHTVGQVLTQWCDMLSQRSGGDVACNVLPRAVAGPVGAFDAVKNGLTDVSYAVHGYTPGRFVFTQIAEMPFLGESAEATSVAYQRVFSRTPVMAEEHKGVKVLAVFTHGPGMVLNTRRPIADVNSLRGLKFRTGGGMANELGKALGMSLTLKPAPETHELLSTGVMDGTLLPAEGVASFNLSKTVRHATRFPGGLYNTSFVFMMNPAKYAALPPRGRQAIDALSGEVAARLFGRAWDEADRRGLATMQADGVEITQANPTFVRSVKEHTASVAEAWARVAQAKGMPRPLETLQALRAEASKAP